MNSYSSRMMLPIILKNSGLNSPTKSKQIIILHPSQWTLPPLIKWKVTNTPSVNWTSPNSKPKKDSSRRGTTTRIPPSMQDSKRKLINSKPSPIKIPSTLEVLMIRATVISTCFTHTCPFHSKSHSIRTQTKQLRRYINSSSNWPFISPKTTFWHHSTLLAAESLSHKIGLRSNTIFLSTKLSYHPIWACFKDQFNSSTCNLCTI